MIEKVLNAPVNLYFDITPSGRFLNRFSKDLAGIELKLNYMWDTAYVNFYILVSIFVISLTVVFYIAAIFPFLALGIYYLFRQAIAGNKEVKRIKSVTKSPLLSLLSETIIGSSTIRAFDR